MYTHILISTDGSQLAQKGVNQGLSLAKALGSKVTIVTVTEPFPVPTIGATGWAKAGLNLDRFDDGNKEHAKAVLSAAKAAAEEMELTVETLHVPNALPAGAIVETAKKQGCDLIVMASHGYRGIKRVLLGSQTSEVIATAHIPVLVIH
ncbi:Universal stress protein, UspA [Nitrobacter sp. Nb-311A]|uniref:universal stress protein n=1 Tax=unclassified Nitrobacter TaxID=2620411 RepID=UPI000068528A|nr:MULTISPECIES: universal stress protein [unclassified Nitrobacter]EAQ34542.1 Universal stress protein, UspA [Nitrobacter sp. Nb-311A]MCB1392179.1 universal stress protein [Nitrobacter sp.]MCV0386703.1 universal stress protein [Nitrobacter sp.]